MLKEASAHGRPAMNNADIAFVNTHNLCDLSQEFSTHMARALNLRWAPQEMQMELACLSTAGIIAAIPPVPQAG